MATGRGRELTLRIVSDTAAIKKSTDAAASGIKGISKAVTGIGAAFGISFAADKFIGFLGDASQAARDDARDTALLNRELQNVGVNADDASSTVDALTSAWAEFGITDDEVRDGLRRSLQLTDDFTTAITLNNLAIDVATAKGIDAAEATDLIVKAMQGQKKAAQNLGLSQADLNDATTTAIALTDKYAGATEAAATQLDKMQVQADEATESVGRWVNQFINIGLGEIGRQIKVIGAEWDFLTHLGQPGNDLTSLDNQIARINRGLSATTDLTRQATEHQMELQKEAAAGALARALGTDTDVTAPSVAVRFKRITFPSLTDDLITAATDALHSQGITTKWKAFWTDELLPALRSGRPRKLRIGQNVLREIGDEIRDGNLNPNALPAPLRRALRNLNVKDAVHAAGITLNKAFTDAFSQDIHPTITVTPKIVIKKGGGGGNFRVIAIPTALPPTPGGTPTSSRTTVGQQAAPTTINVNVSGIGADPVRIGREVSKALDAYRSRGGTIAHRA